MIKTNRAFLAIMRWHKKKGTTHRRAELRRKWVYAHEADQWVLLLGTL